jgi:hypothetical protein
MSKQRAMVVSTQILMPEIFKNRFIAMKSLQILHKVVTDCLCYSFRLRVDLELIVDSFDVRADRINCDIQIKGDKLITISIYEQS